MKIELFINEKEPEIDVDLNEQEMECSPFSFALEQLSQYVNGEIIIYFDELHKINIDLFYDFSVCLDDILKSIRNVRDNLPVDESIWFCEQGSDFYIDYKNKNELSRFIIEKVSTQVFRIVKLRILVQLFRRLNMFLNGLL
ncbi:hypothetical protein [Escherichia sp. E2748]|uniref:hypothetical protein n=1 Tax=Escherichia sp. E2748 TaxID=2044460 RepID=UPI00108199CE|nr:hypothetical protein [Escherichia sp. E2748]TGB93266.1 hypothetical protein CRI64_09985 [Escherichia sp. E2748]